MDKRLSNQNIRELNYGITELLSHVMILTKSIEELTSDEPKIERCSFEVQIMYKSESGDHIDDGWESCILQLNHSQKHQYNIKADPY